MKKHHMILAQVFEDYVTEIQPLLVILKNAPETDKFRLAVVHKCLPSTGNLDHDWIRMRESSLNDRVFQRKVRELWQLCIHNGGLVHDVLREIEAANEGHLKDDKVHPRLKRKEEIQ